MYRRFESLLFDIKKTLLNSDDLRKMLFNNNPNALSSNAPLRTEVENNIFIKPIIFIDEETPENDLSSFISLGIIESVKDDGNLMVSIKISVVCHRDIWVMDNNRIRPLAMKSLVVNSLDGTKFDPAGKLVFSVSKEVFFNNNLVGFTLLFDISDTVGSIINEY